MTDFPSKVVVTTEYEANLLKIRGKVQAVQEAFLALRDSTDFKMPKTLAELTPDYVNEYYQPYIDHIKNDVTFEDTPDDKAKRNRLLNAWYRKRSQAIRYATTFYNAMHNADLRLQYDHTIQCIVPSTRLADLAAKMSEKEIPEEASEHWQKIQSIAESVRELREWEHQRNIAKKPLQSLCAMTIERFCQEWASGGFNAPQGADANTMARWHMLQKSIF